MFAQPRRAALGEITNAGGNAESPTMIVRPARSVRLDGRGRSRRSLDPRERCRHPRKMRSATHSCRVPAGRRAGRRSAPLDHRRRTRQELIEVAVLLGGALGRGMAGISEQALAAGLGGLRAGVISATARIRLNVACSAPLSPTPCRGSSAHHVFRNPDGTDGDPAIHRREHRPNNMVEHAHMAGRAISRRLCPAASAAARERRLLAVLGKPCSASLRSSAWAHQSRAACSVPVRTSTIGVLDLANTSTSVIRPKTEAAGPARCRSQRRRPGASSRLRPLLAPRSDARRRLLASTCRPPAGVQRGAYRRRVGLRRACSAAALDCTRVPLIKAGAS